jgi:hypothetical protein
MMDPLQRAVPVPEFEIVVHRALRRQVFGQCLPLASGPEHIENPVQDLAHVHRPLTSTVSRRRDHRRDKRPLDVGQIARITKTIAVRCAAVFGCPHGVLHCESSTQQGITSDSSDSRTSRIGSQLRSQAGKNLAHQQVASSPKSRNVDDRKMRKVRVADTNFMARRRMHRARGP